LILRPEILADRWARLRPATEAIGPDDGAPRPAVALFHGCGGLRPHLARYARAAAAVGVRAFIVDSYAARGWPRAVAMATVCSGSIFRGHERAGDVAAAIWGISRRPDVDPSRLALAGWSHGGWGIMELMTADLDRPNALCLADAHTLDMSGVRAAALVYPYVGPGAWARLQPWRRRPATWLVTAQRDHLCTPRTVERVVRAITTSGVALESWSVDATHAFDEPMNSPPMHYDPALAEQASARFAVFLQRELGLAGAPSAGANLTAA